jgi:hypothetical protein
MKASLLDPHGPFLMVNPLCELEPGEIHSMLLSFAPSEAIRLINCKFQNKKLQIFGSKKVCTEKP